MRSGGVGQWFEDRPAVVQVPWYVSRTGLGVSGIQRSMSFPNYTSI